MFSSKKESQKEPTPKLPWNIQILTTDYLIDGNCDLDEWILADVFGMANNTPTGTRAFSFRNMTAGQVQPTGNLTTPTHSFSKWMLISCFNFVAFIPNDDVCRQVAQKAFKKCQYPVKVAVYAGPYCIRGTVLSNHKDEIRNDPDYAGKELMMLPIQEAEIDSQLPGTKFTGLQVPWLLLNCGMRHGIELT